MNKNEKIPFNKLLNKKEVLAVIAVFVVTMLTLIYIYFSPNHYEGKSPLFFEVRKGESFDQIVNNLYKKDIIKNKFTFRVAAFLYGAEKRVRAARYRIPNDLSYLSLLDLLIKGEADLLREVKIYEGTTLRWLKNKVIKELELDSLEFNSIISDKNTLRDLNISTSTLEGFVVAKTYYIYEKSSSQEVFDSLIQGYKRFWTKDNDKRAKELGLTRSKVHILASIVDGETNKKSEMPKIASVYLNRLKIDMKLQACPTIQYVLPNGWRNLTFKDLKIESPYNTYKYKGLPPGAIGNPGVAALDAVLNPETSDNIFFVADGKGGHIFTRTYSEHLNFANRYRQWLKNLKKDSAKAK